MHPLISEHSIVRALRPENTPPDWKLPKNPEMESLRGERTVFYTRKKAQNGPSSADQALHCHTDQAFSIASCNSCHALSPRGWHPPTSPCPTLSASQNLSSKRIVPTDNVAEFQWKLIVKGLTTFYWMLRSWTSESWPCGKLISWSLISWEWELILRVWIIQDVWGTVCTKTQYICDIYKWRVTFINDKWHLYK